MKRADDVAMSQATSAVELREVITSLKNRAENEREWRESLGHRLDKQDEEADERSSKLNTLIYSGLGTLVLLLLAIVGFFISHLPMFK